MVLDKGIYGGFDLSREVIRLFAIESYGGICDRNLLRLFCAGKLSGYFAAGSYQAFAIESYYATRIY